jgi:acyl carrier protein
MDPPGLLSAEREGYVAERGGLKSPACAMLGVYTNWQARYTFDRLRRTDVVAGTGDHWKLSKAGRLGRFRLQRRDSVSSSVEEKVIGIVSEQLNVPKEDIKPESKFVDDLKADSLDVVELVMEFEEEFEITIPDEDYEKIRTVGDAVKYITEKQGG